MVIRPCASRELWRPFFQKCPHAFFRVTGEKDVPLRLFFVRQRLGQRAGRADVDRTLDVREGFGRAGGKARYHGELKAAGGGPVESGPRLPETANYARIMPIARNSFAQPMPAREVGHAEWR